MCGYGVVGVAQHVECSISGGEECDFRDMAMIRSVFTIKREAVMGVSNVNEAKLSLSNRATLNYYLHHRLFTSP